MPLPFIVDSKPLFRKSNHFSFCGCQAAVSWEFTAILFVLSLFWKFSKQSLHSFHLGQSPNSTLNLLLLSSQCISTTQRSYHAIFFTQGLWVHGCRLYLEVLYCLQMFLYCLQGFRSLNRKLNRVCVAGLLVGPFQFKIHSITFGARPCQGV